MAPFGGQFPQPLATPVTVYIVQDGNDFPAPVKHLADGLLNLNCASHYVPSDALFIASEACHGLQRILLKESLIPRLGRDPTTNVLAPLAGQIMQCATPSASTFFGASYARALYPCNRFSAAIRLLPDHGTVTSVVYLSISVENEVLTTPVEDNAPNPSTDRSTQDPEDLSASSIDETLRAHFFVEPARSDDDIPFPLLLVATYEEIYSVLTSAVLHRHVYGVYTPCVGLAFDPQKCELLVVFAWLAVHDDHKCLQVHVTHGLPTTGALHESGVFDISDPDSARSFATYLLYIWPSLIQVYDSAISNLQNTRETITTSNTGLWRIDQAFDVDILHQKEEHDSSKINQWLLDFRPGDARPCLPPPFFFDMSTNSPRISGGRGGRAVRGELSDRSSLPSIPEDGVVKQQRILSEIQKLENDLKNDDPFAHKVRQNPSNLSASVCAASPAIAKADDPLDPTSTILSDRLFEAQTWYHDLDVPTGVLGSVMLMLNCCIITLPPPHVTQSKGIPYLQFSNKGVEGPKLTKKSFTTGSFSTFTPDGVDALIQYCTATSVETALREMAGMQPLTEVDKGVQTTLLPYLPLICNASKQCQLAVDQNGLEAQHRLGWDVIASVVEDIVSTDGRIYKHLERVVPLARNVRFDADIAGDSKTLPQQKNISLEASTQGVPEISKAIVESDDAAMRSIRAHIKDKLPNRLARWTQNVIDRAASAYLVKLRRAALNLRFKDLRGPPSGVHVLGVDFSYARCDTAVVIAVGGVFPEGTSFKDLSHFDILGDVHQEFDQPASATSTYGTQGDMPSLLEDTQGLCGRVFEGQTASKSAFVSSPLPSLPQSENTGFKDHLRAWLRDLILPLLFLEYKRGRLSPVQGMNQTRFYLVSGVSYLAVIGIVDFPIFGVATVGSRGRLLCAWGTRENGSTKTSIHIADTNCPEWDISNRVQAIRFAIFLIHLRTSHRQALIARFEEVRQDFVTAWKDRKSEGSPLRWTVESQRAEVAYCDLKKRCEDHKKTAIYKDTTKRIGELQKDLKTVKAELELTDK